MKRLILIGLLISLQGCATPLLDANSRQGISAREIAWRSAPCYCGSFRCKPYSFREEYCTWRETSPDVVVGTSFNEWLADRPAPDLLFNMEWKYKEMISGRLKESDLDLRVWRQLFDTPELKRLLDSRSNTRMPGFVEFLDGNVFNQ